MENALYITALIGLGVIGFREHQKIVKMEELYKRINFEMDLKFETIIKDREKETIAKFKEIEKILNS